MTPHLAVEVGGAPGLRRARPTDGAAITRVVREAFAPYAKLIGREPAPMSADYAGLVRSERVHVLDSGQIEAVLVLVPSEGFLLLETVAVAPQHQGRGLGRALIDASEAMAKQQGFAEVRLYTNTAMNENLALYASLGYRETHRATEGGFCRVHMAKALG